MSSSSVRPNLAGTCGATTKSSSYGSSPSMARSNRNVAPVDMARGLAAPGTRLGVGSPRGRIRRRLPVAALEVRRGVDDALGDGGGFVAEAVAGNAPGDEG